MTTYAAPTYRSHSPAGRIRALLICRLRYVVLILLIGCANVVVIASEPGEKSTDGASPLSTEVGKEEGVGRPGSSDSGEDFFEQNVRPVLSASCIPCHGPEKQWNGLRLDSRAAMLQGGELGPSIVPGAPEESRLAAAIRHDGDVQMPPEDKLSEAQIAAVEHWIAIGAPWPEEAASAKGRPNPAEHWAFQPVVEPVVPRSARGPLDGALHPIDCFLAERLDAEGIVAAPPATRRELIRRATLDLTGLLPTAEEVAAFENDDSPRAYEQLIDRLLASPAYGEQWARHWLDVARYSDTKGYVYAREERFWLHAWGYRDWVVQALNGDVPYDQFLLLQIAADQVAPDDPTSWAAMGFLTLGRRFLGVKHDIFDDRIDVVTRGTMGMTVGCARCHDHKYDPIGTRDYYSLYGVFQNCVEQRLPLTDAARKTEMPAEFLEEWKKLEAAFSEAQNQRRAESMERIRRRVTEYLTAQLALSEYPDEAFSQIFSEHDILPAFVGRWRIRLEQAVERGDPIFVPWHAYAAIPKEAFAAQSKAVTQSLQERASGEVHPLVLQQFVVPPDSMHEVAERYGKLLVEIDQQWNAELKRAADAQASLPSRMADASAEELRLLLYGPQSPCTIPDEDLAHTEFMFPTGHTEELWKLQAKIDRHLIDSQYSVPVALRLADRQAIIPARVFRRGNSANLGEVAPRRLPEFLAAFQPGSELRGSGRLDLAEAIVDPRNPLTARVIVNRIWLHHFGAGLVRTPSDFGVRAETPSHPELLDWLAARFVAEGWGVKSLHRQIMLSEAYQRNSRGPIDPVALADAQRIDPENRLLWRMRSRRMAFEELRDNALRASGELDLRLEGKPGDLFDVSYRRRSLYGLIDRQFLPSALRVFDFANPDLHVPQRNQTTVPQQALFFLNNPWMIERAKRLSSLTASSASPEQRVQQIFQAVFQRAATPVQVHDALALVRLADEELVESSAPKASGTDGSPPACHPDRLEPWAQLTHVLLSANEFVFVD